jgi:hypothetical protein
MDTITQWQKFELGGGGILGHESNIKNTHKNTTIKTNFISFI